MKNVQRIRLGIKLGTLSYLLAITLYLFFTRLTQWHTPSHTPTIVSESTWTVSIVLVIIIAPILEEFIFRLIPIKITKTITKNKAVMAVSVIIFSGIIFGGLHGIQANNSWAIAFILGLSGMLFAVAFLKEGYLASIIAHATHNMMVLLTYFITLIAF